MNTLSLSRTHRCLREIMHEVDPQWWSQLWNRPGITMYLKKELRYKPYLDTLLTIIPELEYLDQDAFTRKFINAINYLPDNKYTIVPEESRDYSVLPYYLKYSIDFGGKRTYRTVVTLPLLGAPVSKVKITFDDGAVKEAVGPSHLIAFNIYKKPRTYYNEHNCLILPLNALRAVLLDDTVDVNTNYILSHQTALSKSLHVGIPEECFLYSRKYKQCPSFKDCSTNKVSVKDLRSNAFSGCISFDEYCVHKQALHDILNKDIIQLASERKNAIRTMREICKKYL